MPLLLLLCLILTGTVVSPRTAFAQPRGWHLTLLYTADERGEIVPCG